MAADSRFKHSAAAVKARLGTRVKRAAADIFSGALIPLFNVEGGKILLTHIHIDVSAAAMDATNNNTQLIATPDVGTGMPMCAVLDIISAAIGAVFSIAGPVATAMTGPVAGGGAMAMDRPQIINAGTIDIDGSADSGVGGALGADTLYYIPLEDGAYVTAT